MFTQPVVSAALAVLLVLSSGYLFSTINLDRSFAVSSLSPEEQALIAPELEAAGLTRLTPRDYSELPEKAAARAKQAEEAAKAEVAAIEAEVARNELRRRAEEEELLEHAREQFEALTP